MAWRSTLDALVSVVAPAPCRICEATLLTASRIPICGECLSSFEPIVEPLCQTCGRPFASAVSGQAQKPLCRLCRNDFFAFDAARTYAIYNDSLSQAITLLKYEEVLCLGQWFAARLAEIFWKVQDKWQPDEIVPVPLHRDRRRERGYNQAELIAGPLASKLGLKIRPKLLIRIKPRPPQLLLSRSERWKIVRGAYEIRPGGRVDNLRILLVDDVMTTGATLDACAKALRQAGAKAVMALTVARIVPGWVSPARPRRSMQDANSGNSPGVSSI